jgi:hypothetical protein
MKLSFGSSEAIKATKITLYLPNKDRYGNQVESIQHWIHEARTMFSVLFGGSTYIAEAKGMWFNKTDNIFMEESTAIIMAYVDIEELQKHMNTLQRFVQNFLTITNQDAVAIEFDGYMHFVSCLPVTHKVAV